MFRKLFIKQKNIASKLLSPKLQGFFMNNVNGTNKADYPVNTYLTRGISQIVGLGLPYRKRNIAEDYLYL